MADTFDFKKDRKDLYAPPTTKFVLVDVPAMTFLAVDGQGNPNTSEAYREAIDALYTVSYTAKFASKRELGRDYVVGPLEGLWYADDPAAFVSGAKDSWRWTAMIRQPDWLSPAFLEDASVIAGQKKTLPGLERLKVFPFTEGISLQILYRGPYNEEGPTLARLHDEVMPKQGLTFNGSHHEIYLSDPRRTAPEKLKTILRQPVRPISPQ